jgi:hypothetical protein
MKFPRLTYSTTTNICLILGLASAFGFDRTNHVAWLLLGGCAATWAIATYFRRHWRLKPRAESTSRVSFVSHPDAVESWEPEPQVLFGAMRGVSPELSPRALYWRTKESESAASWNVSLRHAGSEPSDPIAQVSRIIRQLQATGERRVYKVAFAPNGSVTLTITDDAAQSQTSDLAQLTDLELPETVVQ